MTDKEKAIVIVIGDKSIYADGYILNPKEKSVLFYREKSDLDYIPPIKVNANVLSDFGRELLQAESEDKG